MGTFIKIVISLAIIAVVAAGGVWFAFETYTRSPVQPEARDVTIIVPPGASFSQVIDDMVQQGVITDPYTFKLLVRVREQRHNLKAGEYLMNTAWTPERILKELVTGKGVLHTLSFQEGLTWWQVAEKLEQQGFAKAEDFSKVIHDPAFLKANGIPFANAEGFLFPETYKLNKPRVLNEESARKVASLLVQTFWRKTASLWSTKPPSAEELRRVVILATLVEKETAVPSERPRVAGVYANRIRKGMRMQADPTIIYGIGKDFDGDIRKENILDKTNSYNTYQIKGLPPGPICSPGLEAIKAAISPESHNYIYFVARGDGSHKFSKTLKEHNHAVRKYQLK